MGQFRLIRIFRVYTFLAITHLFTFIIRHLIEPYRIFFRKIYHRTHRGKQIFRSIVHPVGIKRHSVFVTNMTIYDMTCCDK